MYDVAGYIERLDKSMTKDEKLFFLDKVDLSSYDNIIDFGCADGRLLHEIDLVLPPGVKPKLYGVEINNDIPLTYGHITRVRTLAQLSQIEGSTLVIFSSVLHEVALDVLQNHIIPFLRTKADTIVIRDMHWNRRKKTRWTRREVRLLTNVIQTSKYLKRLNEIIDNHSWLYNDLVETLYEFLLKYEYDANWDTEKKEYYFINNTERIMEAMTRECGFKKKYFKAYILPYKREKVKADFGYNMRYTTHLKAILGRTKQNKKKYQ